MLLKCNFRDTFLNTKTFLEQSKNDQVTILVVEREHVCGKKLQEHTRVNWNGAFKSSFCALHWIPLGVSLGRASGLETFLWKFMTHKNLSMRWIYFLFWKSITANTGRFDKITKIIFSTLSVPFFLGKMNKSSTSEADFKKLNDWIPE